MGHCSAASANSSPRLPLRSDRLALTRFLAPLVPLALLAACGDDPAEDSDGRSASGEVLEGTISDAMLPVDQVRSEAPLEDPEAFAAAQEKAGAAAPRGARPDAEAEPAQPDADEDEAEEAPAEEPAPEGD